VLGFFLPDLQLRQAGKKRQSEIDDALPDFLDVLAVTVSAGLSFRSSLRKVVERTDGPLAVEMQRTLRQMEVGEPRTVAFTNLRKRTESDALEKFVVALVQAEELGAPLVDALDQIALDMRRDTAQRARQQASKASPQIAGVVTMVMVPGTMVLILATMWFGSGFDSMELF
jgi:tight adherence protein C